MPDQIQEKKIKIAYKNGFRAGWIKGIEQGYAEAHFQIIRSLEPILKWEKKRKVKEVHAFCWKCLTGLRKQP